MAYNPKDVFPTAQAPTMVDFASLCAWADPTTDVPVTYVFGGAGPAAITFGGRLVIEAKSQGPFGPKQGSTTGVPARYFAEYYPYSWDPYSPEWNGA